jgi:hypothetical protein
MGTSGTAVHKQQWMKTAETADTAKSPGTARAVTGAMVARTRGHMMGTGGAAVHKQQWMKTLEAAYTTMSPGTSSTVIGVIVTRTRGHTEGTGGGAAIHKQQWMKTDAGANITAGSPETVTQADTADTTMLTGSESTVTGVIAVTSGGGTTIAAGTSQTVI